VLALVIVVDFGKAIDHLGDRSKLRRWHRHRCQRAGADSFGREDRADARDLAFAAQRLKPLQDSALGHPQAGRQFGKGRRTERKVALKFVQQAKIELPFVGLSIRNPVRFPRLVKKMPLGACAGNSPIFSKVAVS
jgi:hypothetical protein